TELQVLVAAANHPRRLQARRGQRERYDAESVVSINKQFGASAFTRGSKLVETGDDARRLEQDRRYKHRGGAVIDSGSAACGGGVGRRRGQPHQFDAFLGETGKLAAKGVELAIGCDQPGPLAQVERGQEADHQLVSVGAERELTRGIVEQ